MINHLNFFFTGKFEKFNSWDSNISSPMKSINLGIVIKLIKCYLKNWLLKVHIKFTFLEILLFEAAGD